MRTVLTRLSLLAVLVSLLAVAAPPTALTQDAPPAAGGTRTEDELRRLFQGAWHLVQPEATARSRIDSGIERAVGEMNYFLQGVARDQMRANTPLNRRIDIGFEAATAITIAFDQRFTYTTRPSVSQTFSLPDGGSVDVRQYFRDGNLEQYFETSLGRRWNVYHLSEDGRTMTINATQQAPTIPAQMHFTLDYRLRT